jgi:iron complex outermembrane receptor protein
MATGLKASLLAATVLGATFSAPAYAQASDEDGVGSGNDIVVTARRIEERLQDVPISITVLSSESLTNNNIQSAKDIATYTPGLTTNNRYGSDNTTWTIRGFTQEQRTTATVGTYFADVVAPRGSGATQGGDGAGPGNLFDLNNVQVLKGPQGTLQGRNSTGGAVLLVPVKPTDRLEGYVEGQIGDYDLRRVQAVLNVPLAETFRVRLGVDRNKRDGYLKNAGNIGFGPFGNAGGSVDYVAGRLSIVGDLTPNLENYIIASYSHTKSTGVIPKINARKNNGGFLVNGCFTADPLGTAGARVLNPSAAPVGFGPAAGATPSASCAQAQREAALGFWSVSNGMPDHGSETETWQVINRTTWQAGDNLTVTNIMSYAEFIGDTNLDLFGFYQPLVPAGTETNGLQVKTFNTTHFLPNGHTNAQSSFVEEFRLNGSAADGKLIWQGGLYYELNAPLGTSGIQSTTQTPCSDIEAIVCLPGQNASSIGRLGYQWHRNKFEGKAAYFQASYSIVDKLTFTAGLRYTQDKVTSDYGLTAIRLYSAPVTASRFPTGAAKLILPAGNYFYCVNDNPRSFGSPSGPGVVDNSGVANAGRNPLQPLGNLKGACAERSKVKTTAPTWLLGLDYKPMDDVLLYAKWSRGYRQGGVAPFAADLLQNYDKESVDTYEVGAKASWRGSFPGYFNISAFYNDFKDQQLQIGLSCFPVSDCAQTTAIINAASSTLKGVEIEAGISPFEGLQIDASYAYLQTKIKDIVDLRGIVSSLGLPFSDVRGLPVGGAIPNAMPHKAVVSAKYTLPLDRSIGRLSFGGTFVYQSRYRAVSDPFLTNGATGPAVQPFVYASKFGVLPSSKMINLNVTWENVGGLPVDAGFFATNVTKEKTFLHANVQAANGFVSNIIGEPRMYGLRLRYKFGD